MHTPAHLPGVLAQIAAVAGEEAALKLATARGGTQIYLPPVPGDDHWLVGVVGLEAARRICEELTCGVGPARIDLPLGPAGAVAKIRAEVDRLIRANKSEREIALATGYTARAIRRRRAQLGHRDSRQFSLF